MAAKPKNPQEGDFMFPSPPTDSISSIAINGTINTATTMLISTSWDNSVNCYEISGNGVVPRAQMKHDAPVLCSDISTDQYTAFTGGCDNTVRMWNVTQPASSAQIIGRHDQPVRTVKWHPESSRVLTASWDKTIRLWDCRQPQPSATVPLSEKIYAMDGKGQAVVAATADNKVHVFDLTAGRLLCEFKSMFNYQTKSLSIFHDNKGFAMGSIEGRICLEYFDELHLKNAPGGQTNKQATKNFCYKCHRLDTDVFAVNALTFSPRNTFASIGSDGVIYFWDMIARHKLHALDLYKRTCPGVDIKYSPNGQLLFYAMSYDWSKGVDGNDAKFGSSIFVHPVQPIEITPKDLTKK